MIYVLNKNLILEAFELNTPRKKDIFERRTSRLAASKIGSSKNWLKNIKSKHIAKSGLVGSAIGALPGIGGAVASHAPSHVSNIVQLSNDIIHTGSAAATGLLGDTAVAAAVSKPLRNEIATHQAAKKINNRIKRDDPSYENRAGLSREIKYNRNMDF